jgi:hypothetical protein
MCSLQSSSSVASTFSVEKMDLFSCNSNDFTMDDDWGHFVDVTPPNEKQIFLKHGLALSSDERFNLLKSQQMIHML